jgi:hypothetical protein
MEMVFDDGGRSRYFKGQCRDCVTRAIAIATVEVLGLGVGAVYGHRNGMPYAYERGRASGRYHHR